MSEDSGNSSPASECQSVNKCLSSLITAKKFNDGLSFLNAFKTGKNLLKSIESEDQSLAVQKWQVWCWNADQQKRRETKWEDMLAKKSAFNTIDEFWNIYSDMNGFRLLKSTSDYYVFKAEIKPMWEDVRNVNGGRWVLKFAKRDNWNYQKQLDDIWLKLLLSIIGGKYDVYDKELCGAVLSFRAHSDKIALWTTNADHLLVNLKIGFDNSEDNLLDPTLQQFSDYLDSFYTELDEEFDGV